MSGGGVTPTTGDNLAALFPADSSDEQSDLEDEQRLSIRRRASDGTPLPAGEAAATATGLEDHSYFSRGKICNFPLETLDSTNFSQSLPHSATTGFSVDKRKSSKRPLGWGRRKAAKEGMILDISAEDSATQSPFHANMGLALPGDEADDLEAARKLRASPSKSPPITISEAESDFELNKDRSPAEWMRIRDTTGMPFLWYTVVLQITSACASVAYLNSAGENQLSWKTGCWGSWTLLSDVHGVEFVEFDTHVGWQLYGKGSKLGHLGEISRSAAIVGALAGAMHTLVIFFACMFLMFSVTSLCMSYGVGGGRSIRRKRSGPGQQVIAARDESALVLGRDCHRWMFLMAGVNIFAGLWSFGLGCAGFYLAVTRDFTDGLVDLVSTWGEEVTCATPQTRPRYGFFANALGVVLLLGGGTISFAKTRHSARELGEAVDVWKRDRAEEAELRARMAMIKKKEDYANAAAAAAAAAVGTSVIVERVDRARTSAPLSLSPARPIARGATATATMASEPVTSQVSDKQTLQARIEGVELDVESRGATAVSPEEEEEEEEEEEKDDDRPLPEGWDMRATPAGEKFWVNITTKTVSWERPS